MLFKSDYSVFEHQRIRSPKDQLFSMKFYHLIK